MPGVKSNSLNDQISAQTLTPLAANASYTTGWIETTGFKEIYSVIFSDQLSASPAGIVIEYSNDGTTILDSASRPYTVVNDFSRSSFPVTTKFIRYTYNNGSTAQTKFQLTIALFTTPLGSSKTTLSNSVGGLALAETTRGPIEQPTTSTGNDFVRITRTVSGDKSGLDVNVLNPSGGALTDAQLRATSVPVSQTQPSNSSVTTVNPVVSGDKRTLTMDVKQNASLLALGLLPFEQAASGIAINMRVQGY